MSIDTNIKIPTVLVYEIDDGKPIYYRGYQQQLNEHSTLEDMPDSIIQAWLKLEIAFLLRFFFKNKNYVVTVGEQGLNLNKKVKRAADIAIFNKENFELTNHYSNVAPEVAIEIDIKGDYESPTDVVTDYEKKISQLFKFGVKKIIWIFTEEKIVNVITPNQRKRLTWNKDINVLEEVKFNLAEIMKDFEK